MYRDSIELYEKLTSGDTEDLVLRSRLEAYLQAIIDKGVSLGNTPNGKPIVVATKEDMDSILENATDEDVGKFYHYTGETTDVYIGDAVYFIQKEEE